LLSFLIDAVRCLLFSQPTITSGRELNLFYAQTLYLTALSFRLYI